MKNWAVGGRTLRLIRERFSVWGVREVVLCLVVGPLALIAGVLTSDAWRLQEHAMPGVLLLERPVGGYSKAALAELLAEEKERTENTQVRVRVGKETFDTRLGEVGVSADSEAVLAETLRAGRGDGPVAWVGKRLGQWFGAQHSVAMSYSIDTAKVHEAALSWGEALAEPAEGAIKLEKGRLVAQWPKAGQVVDVPALITQLEELARGRSPGETIEPRTAEQHPRLSRQAVERALSRARALTERALTLRHPDDAEKRVTFSRKVLRRAIHARVTGEPAELVVRFALPGLAAAIDAQRSNLELEPQDAGFEIDRRENVTIVPSQTGTRIDEHLVAGELGRVASSGESEGVVPLRTGVPPRLTTVAAEGLTIKGLVSTFTTQHPCCAPRVKNIHRIADLIDGTIVSAGETFSVNQAIGPRTAARGFVAAPTIVLGEIKDTVGGGVSQFATTFFNAVLKGGYEIVERQPHSFYFTRYPAGHEATLSYPKPDFIFRNDTASGVLVKTQYGSTFIRVKIYGDNEGRLVKRQRGKRYDAVEPQLVYEADDELDPEEEKVVEPGQVGWTIQVSRTITFADGNTKKESRAVTYKPRDRLVRVHSCRIPEGEEGYTGDECPEPDPCDPEDPECEELEPGSDGECAPDDEACQRYQAIEELVEAKQAEP